MTRFSRQASLFLALSLLTPAATAHAECAWVLWREFIMLPPASSDPTGNRFWDVVNAYSGPDACQQALKLEEERRKRAFEDVKREAAEGKAIAAIQSKAICLPDTVDPRGPKGK